MKNLIVLLLLLVGVTFAAAPTANSLGAPYYSKAYYTISASANSDTILTDADSVILASDFTPEAGYEYVYVRDANTGSGSDSAFYQVMIRCKTAKGGTVLYSLPIDTVVALAGEAIKLPFNETLFGGAYKIVLKGISGSTGVQVIVNKGYIYQRRAVVVNKDWN